MSRVLVVEDEAHLAQGLQFNLEAEGYSVRVVGDGESALRLLLGSEKGGAGNGHEAFDAVVLDVMLPGKDGFAVVSELRAAKTYIPVLMLTARGRPEDVLQGFAAGADDYLPKPFELAILLARLQSLLRRWQWHGTTKTDEPTPRESIYAESPEYDVLSFAGRTIDFGKLELRIGHNTVHLTLMEAELLRYLIRNQGRAVSRKAILEEVWQLHEDTDTRAIDNFVVRLRRYIEDDPAAPRHLLTVRGLGYRFVVEPSQE
jgi:DNA-binding response OmpR family regulator